MAKLACYCCTCPENGWDPACRNHGAHGIRECIHHNQPAEVCDCGCDYVPQPPVWITNDTPTASCTICSRTLNVEGDPDSRNCGGDCYGCVRPLEHGDDFYMGNIVCPTCGSLPPFDFEGEYKYVTIGDINVQVSLVSCRHYAHTFPIADVVPPYADWPRLYPFVSDESLYPGGHQ